MSDEKKYSFQWWHGLLGVVAIAAGLYFTLEQRLGQKAIDKEHADSAFAWAQTFHQNEWLLPKIKSVLTQGPPAPQNLHSHNH